MPASRGGAVLNRESDRLPQINLLLLFDEKSGLPFYYRKLSGNIPDVKTVSALVKELTSEASGILGGIPERQAVRRVHRADIPGIHQQEDAGAGTVQRLYDGETAAGPGIHPRRLRTWTGADCLRGPGEAAQPLCGIGRHAAAMTLLVMRWRESRVYENSSYPQTTVRLTSFFLTLITVRKQHLS